MVHFMPRRLAVLVAASLFACAATASAVAAEDEAPEQYPDGPHRDQAFYSCTACHGFKLVAAQGLSRERWDETLTLMTERHKMPALEGDDRQKVLDYLEAAFPPRLDQGARGWKNPFAK